MKRSIRWLVALLLVVAIQGGVLAIRRGSEPAQVAALPKDLQQLPLQLNAWSGEAVSIDPQIFLRTGAEQAVDRVYRDRMGRAVTAHVAAWREYGLDVPHHPEECLTGAGQRIVSEKLIPVKLPDGSTCSARLLATELNGSQRYVLYWYDLGGRTLLDNPAMRRAHWELRGRTTWPPLIKVMLQTTAPTATVAENQLGEIATAIAAWIQGEEGDPQGRAGE